MKNVLAFIKRTATAHLEAYHQDLDNDLQVLEERPPGRYLWGVRRSGTRLLTLNPLNKDWGLTVLKEDQVSRRHIGWWILDTNTDTITPTTRDHAITRFRDLNDPTYVTEPDTPSTPTVPLYQGPDLTRAQHALQDAHHHKPDNPHRIRETNTNTILT